jgi:putative ABC transport system permease protein
VNFLRSLETALANLRANKLRSALTMLGVIIGVSAVIVIVCIVGGAQATVVREFERLGAKLIIVAYNPEEARRSRETRLLEGLTMDDVRAIRSECDLLQSVSAELPAGEFTARYLDKEMKVNALGVQPEYTRLRDLPVARGRFIDENDIADWAKVVVIGDKVRRDLFGSADPLGKDIEIQGVSVTIIGILEPKGRAGDQDADKQVLVPITAIQKRFLGRELVAMMWATPKQADMLNAAMDQIWQTLMRRHNNAKGFQVDSLDNIQQAIGRILAIFGLVLGGVAGLALLVGGIGIMNIMLVSVTERTREIGLRKAVGARRRDILWQFLIEAATVSGVGGLIGIGLGAAMAHLIGAISRQFIKSGMGGQPGIAIHLPWWAVVGAFAFSATVGVFFGLYPAVRAARLDPIEALRYE